MKWYWYFIMNWSPEAHDLFRSLSLSHSLSFFFLSFFIYLMLFYCSKILSRIPDYISLSHHIRPLLSLIVSQAFFVFDCLDSFEVSESENCKMSISWNLSSAFLMFQLFDEFWEEDIRGKLHSHHIPKYFLSWWLITDNADLDHLAEKMFIQLLHCKYNFFCPFHNHTF